MTPIKKYKVMTYVFILFVILSLICFLSYVCVSCKKEEKNNEDKYLYYKHSDEIVQSDLFRNPNMKEDTLYNINKFCKENNVSYSKVLGVALLDNEFDLSKFEEEYIDITLYGKKYSQLISKNKDNKISLYFDAIEMIYKDVEVFPVITNKNKGYLYSYEDTFGSSRNFNGDYLHEGTDIMASVNEAGLYQIVSVSDGVVEKVGWLPKGGYRIGIRGKNGGYFYYAHLQEGSIVVKEGDSVESGQLLGYMGDTGYGPEGTKGKFPVHLHFGIYINTRNCEEISVNPFYILKYLEQKVYE